MNGTGHDVYHFQLAGHVFAFAGHHLKSREAFFDAYRPFSVEPAGEPLFVIEFVDTLPDLTAFTEETRQDAGQGIISGTMQGEPCYTFFLHYRKTAVMLVSDDFRRARLFIRYSPKYSINTAVMLMYTFSTAGTMTTMFHSSVVSYRGRAYLFLGRSGTGKSTHAALWVKHIEGAELVNDDNPVVRVIGEEAYVYGSPWSGKTPCYRNVRYPIGAVIDLRQAPANSIRRLRPIEAYATLLPSVSCKRWDRHMADAVHTTENELIRLVPFWHLDCLPDADAARLCCRTCSGNAQT